MGDIDPAVFDLNLVTNEDLPCPTSTVISFFLLNIRSIRRNLDALLAHLNYLETLPDIIFLTEIWISTTEINNYSLENYNFYACCNDDYRSGGCAVFVKKNIVHCFKKLELKSADALELIVKYNNTHMNFILTYRLQTHNVSEFLNELEVICSLYQNRNFFFLGDININILNKSATTDDYYSILASVGLDSLINVPTRVDLDHHHRAISSTCIDHVFARFDNHISVKCEVQDLMITDHKLIQIDVSFISKKAGSPSNDFSSFVDYNKIDNLLLTENWFDILADVNPSTAYVQLVSKIKSIIELSTAIKPSKNKIKKLKPWMNNNLANMIKARNTLAKKSKQRPNDNVILGKLLRISKRIDALIPILKNKCYTDKFEIARDPKSKWRVVNEIVNSKVKENNIIRIIDKNGILKETPSDIANIFNYFFSNIANNLVETNSESITISDVEKNKFLYEPKCPNSIFLEPTDIFEIISIVKGLKNSHSIGSDNISSVFVKKFINHFAHVLVHVFNLCLIHGIFPDALKIAVVLPLFKKGNHLDTNCYRPISLLNTFSKIFEKILKVRLMHFLNKYKIISDRQFGFRQKLSTEDALLEFLTPIYEETNNGKKVAALFVDICKAFDTVNHSLLLLKMENIGIRGVALSLFESYLKNRSQTVKIGQSFSEFRNISVGVPQGSVLGPILFLLYLGTIFKIQLKGKITAYADDMGLVYYGANSTDLEAQIAHDLRLMRLWFNLHEMVLSPKTKVMFFDFSINHFSSRYITCHTTNCAGVSCSDLCFPIETVSEYKYLGLLLDHKLNWKSHVAHLKKALMIATRKLYILRFYASKEILRVLYFALIDSLIQYGITCWGGIYFENLKPVVILQKHIIRIINFKNRLSPSLPLFKLVKALPIRNLYIFKVLKIFFKRSGQISIVQNNFYKLRNNSRNVCSVPKPRTERYRRFFNCTAPFLFNKLPDSLRVTTMLKKFLLDLRNWLQNFVNVEEIFIIQR